MKTTIRISASQISLFESCNRKWYYERVLGLKTPTTASQALGTAVHTHAEEWLLQGKLPPDTPAGRILRAGLAHLPVPKTAGLRVEEEFTLHVPTPDDIEASLIGYKDIYLPGVQVWDIKTTKSDRYIKEPEELYNDIQAGIYGYNALQEAPELTNIPLKWVYYLTTGAPRCIPVSVQMDRAQANKSMDRAADMATKAGRLKVLQPKAEDVEPNTRACSAFGGCPHRSYCATNKTSVASSGSTWGDLLSSLQSSIKPDNGDDMVSLRDKLRALNDNVATPPPPAMVPAIPANDDVTPIIVPPGINPPDAAVSPDDIAPPEEIFEPADLPTPTEAPKPARKPRAKAVSAPPAETSAPTAATPSVPSTPATVAGGSGDYNLSKKGRGSLILLIDALPLKGVSAAGEQLLDEAAEMVIKQAGVDYRLVEYGKGVGMYLLAFSDVFERRVAPALALGETITLSVSSWQPEVSIVLRWLTNRADVVFKGTR